MDKKEARRILDRRISDLRRESYVRLTETWLDQSACDEVVGESGVRYQVETEAFWDDRPSINLRVTVAIDDGGWSAFAPLTDSFIVAPDDSLIGE